MEKQTKMTIQQFAELLNGRQYGEETNEDIDRLAKAAGYAIFFGASDDLLEVRGAIYDELGAWNGCKAVIYRVDGKWNVMLLSDFEEDMEIARKFGGRTVAHHVEAQWSPEDPPCSWLFTTDAPSASFDIMEGGELYCRGIVVDLNNL